MYTRYMYTLLNTFVRSIQFLYLYVFSFLVNQFSPSMKIFLHVLKISYNWFSMPILTVKTVYYLLKLSHLEFSLSSANLVIYESSHSSDYTTKECTQNIFAHTHTHTHIHTRTRTQHVFDIYMLKKCLTQEKLKKIKKYITE